jgi:hypothetical protein
MHGVRYQHSYLISIDMSTCRRVLTYTKAFMIVLVAHISITRTFGDRMTTYLFRQHHLVIPTTCRHVDKSTNQQINKFIRRFVDSSIRRFVDSSIRRYVGTSIRSVVEKSTLQLADLRSCRRVVFTLSRHAVKFFFLRTYTRL